MNGTLTLSNIFNPANARSMAAPVFIVLILAMLVLPLPPFALDMLFTFNIALSIMVLLVGLSTKKALDFAAFPTVLLLSTLLRLSLNVASTRVVLLEGHTGPDAAGKVIEAFGHFLVGGNYTVGIIVFVILVVINFIVITKGAGRIAEVSARFALDAMPGKQMAIDADLNAGLIDENEARRRRAEVSQEADFYGSMDGASKFVRGDAIAGILILLINIVGGLIVGVMQHDLSLADAARNYTLLAIGDGLVAQIPALVISIAAGIIVSRVSTDEDIAGQMLSNIFSKTQALYITAAILGMMGMIPGMPNFAFLLLAGGMVWLAYRRGKEKPEVASEVESAPVAAVETQEASWEDVAPIDTLGLEVGYRLIPLVDNAADGELVRRIKGIRKKFAREIGFLPPAVHIRDNLEINPNSYRITLKGVEIGSGEVRTGLFLAIDPGNITATLPGVATRDPAFDLPAVWIEAEPARAGPVHGLHRGGPRHGGGDASESSGDPACRRTAGASGSPGPARSPGQECAQAGGRSGAEDAHAVHGAKGTANPADRRRGHPRHAHHHRHLAGTWRTGSGSARTDRVGAGGAGSFHRAADLWLGQRTAGHCPGSGTGTPAAANPAGRQ